MNDRVTDIRPQAENRASDQGSAGLPPDAKPRRARSWRLFAGILAGLVVLVGGGWWLYQQFTHVFVDDARVAADMVAVSSRVSGWVTAVDVIEGDPAKKGHVLVSIDSRESRTFVGELDARLAGIKARREELEARIQMIDRQTATKIQEQRAVILAAQAALEANIAQENLAQIENGRAEKLVPSGAETPATLDRTRAALKVAHQQILGAQANVQTAQAGLAQAEAAREELNVIQRQLAELGPEEQQLRHQRERALLDLQDRTITIPFDGSVDRVFVVAGDYVTPGQWLLMVHDPERVRVEANVKETDIRFFRRGKTVAFTVDAVPKRVFTGTVERVGDAATSEFALLPNPNPSGNFTKISQRLRVRISVRHWVYARDDRPWGGADPPAAVYFYSPDRKAERPATHLQDFRGVLHS